MSKKQSRGGFGDGKQPQKKKMNYKQKQSISFVNDDDPPFIRAMKQKMGYQEPKIEDKFNEEELNDDDERDPDDILQATESERPAVVVLDPKRDLTVDDLDEAVKKQIEEDDRRKIEEGRITFKKPVKRTVEEETQAETSEEKRPKVEPKVEPKKANSKMLSFGDDEEE